MSPGPIERRVAEVAERIATYERKVAELESEGRDATETKKLLSALRRSMKILQAERAAPDT